MKKISKLLSLLMFFGIAFQLSAYAVPTFEYTGTYTTKDDSNYRYIYLKSSGKLKFTANAIVDVALVGGGAGGRSGVNKIGGGGGTVYIKESVSITANNEYSVTIGLGGKGETAKKDFPAKDYCNLTDKTKHHDTHSPCTVNTLPTSGEATSAFGYTAAGGSIDGGGQFNTAGSNGTNIFGLGLYGGSGSGCSKENGSAIAGGSGGGGYGATRDGTGGDGSENTGGGGGSGGISVYNKGADEEAEAYRNTWSLAGSGGAGGSGIVIIRIKLETCEHTGGTHANGGTCTKCGEVYQNHTGSVTGYDNTIVTPYEHTAIYSCTFPGCNGRVKEMHNFSDGECTKCSYECQGTLGAHLKGTYDLGGSYGKVERESGQCLVCGKFLGAHSQSNDIVFYTKTNSGHIPYYRCSQANNGCTSLFEGAEEGHSFTKVNGVEQCSKCGYYKGSEIYDSRNIATCENISRHANDKQYYDPQKLTTESEQQLATAIPLKVDNAAQIEGNTEQRYKSGDKIQLSGSNYADKENIHWYEVVFLSDIQELTAPLKNYFHWKVRLDGTYVHRGPSYACRVGVHEGNAEYACQNKGLFNGGVGGIFEFGTGTEGHKSAINRWKQISTWVNEFAYENLGARGQASEADVLKKALELLTIEINNARIEKGINYDVFLKNNSAANEPNNYVEKLDVANDIISLQYLDPEYIHCCNSYNYELIDAYATLTAAQRCKHKVDGREKIYGDISVRFEGFTVSGFSGINYEEEAAKWPSGVNAEKTLVSEKAKWNFSFNIDKLVREEIRFEERNGIKEPYGMIYVTSTAPDGTTQTVEIKVPLAYEYSNPLKHITANLTINDLAWDQEKLYRPGDILELDGIRCIYDEVYEILGETEKEFSEYNGVIINFKGFEVESDGRRIGSTDMRYNKNEEVVWGERGYNYEDAELRYWNTASYKIVDISNASYDSARGVHYGVIEIIGLAEHGDDCKITRKIYFGTPVEEVFYPVDVTIKINPSDDAGTVTVDYIAHKSYTEVETVTGAEIRDNEGAGTIIRTVLGTSITIHSSAKDGYIYRDITNIHGNKLDGSEKTDFSYGPINLPMTFIVNFEKDPSNGSPDPEDPIDPSDPQSKYTLYVTSTEGGTAWLEDPRISTNEDEMYNKFGSRIYTVHNVDGGEEFTLYYETYEGYKFEKWEYRPRIQEDSSGEGLVNITMPYSDLTATAVFKKVKQEEPNTEENGEKKYTLRVTSNNELWGDAWAYIDGSWKDLSDNAVAGDEYLVYFKANPGYYFTNWDYDSLNSPFIYVDKESGYGKIKMPNNDLEIKAFFSPIPEPGENPEEEEPDIVDPGTPDPPAPDPNPDNPNPDPNPENIPEEQLHRIYFVSELNERCDNLGGTVPEDLINVRGGAKITMAVTPYSGYRFVRWYFTEATEHKTGSHDNESAVTPDNEYDSYGSGSFIMTDYDIVAHAVFEEVAQANKLTIKIVGEGSVFVEDINIPSGSWYEAEPDQIVTIGTKPADGWEYIYTVDEDGANLWELPEFTFKMPEEDTVLIVHFGYNDKEEAGPYTLYVTSMYGGNAWTEGNDKHPREEIEVTQNNLGQYIYTVRNVYAGEKFEIYYNLQEQGYSFDEWEYRPYITPDKEGRGVVTITMPYSDLTVTAVFKNDTIQENPKLSVTSNNPEWGNAYVIVDNTRITATNMVAEAGVKYELVYEANEGYYFTNWDYSTTDTPFIDAAGLAENEAMIVMPNKNLEIMAFFSPIPEPGPDSDSIIDPDDPDPDIPKPVVEGHTIDFIAEPPEGGRVPQDLKDIKPGSKVTIAVTPNQGWEFSHWYFKDKDGIIVSPIVSYDEDGTGYFIMPDYPIEAIAVFKRAGIYNLYITYTTGGTAWTLDNGIKTTWIDDAISRELYDICYEATLGYEFVGWNYRWDDEADSLIIPWMYEDEGKVIMPRSDLTVTAVFKEANPIPTSTPTLKVTSNNYLWGDAFIKVNGEWKSWRVAGSQHPSAEPGVVLEAGKEYEVRFEAFPGYKFTDWIASDLGYYFTKYPDFENGETVGIIKMPDHNIELMAYFKPGEQPDSEKVYYTLTLETDPDGAATLFGEGMVEDGTERYVGIDDYDPEEYRFKYWYIKDASGKEIKISYSKNFNYTVRENITLYAKFTPISHTIADLYTVTIIKEGNGTGYVRANGQNYVTNSTRSNITCEKGTEFVLKAIEGTDSFFTGWTVNGKAYGSLSEIDLTITGDTTIIVSFTQEKIIPQGTIEDFKIISVRDLRWQEYFVDDSGKLTGNVFTAPVTTNSAEVMLKSRNNISDELKMGYAVEFELVTTTYDHERAVLVVTPEILDKNGKTVVWSKITDALTNNVMDANYMKTVKDFGKVIIVHNTTGKSKAKALNDSYQASYQTSSSWNSNATNNGISTEEITWRWLYYMPAKISGVNGPITVKLNVEIYEMADDFSTLPASAKKFDMVTYLNTYKNTEWDGRAYKYSATDSLLDDIYNNAT